MRTLAADGDGKPQIHKLVLRILQCNLIFNMYVVCSYCIVVSSSQSWAYTYHTNLSAILTIITLICVVFVAAIITLYKNEVYMVSMTLKVLFLDIFCLLYFYYKIIDLNMVTLWQIRIKEYITDLPLFWRERVEEVLIVLIVPIVLFPLCFKILSAFVVGLFKAKLGRSSFNKLPSYDDAVLHFSSAPSQELNFTDDDFDFPLPPYTKHPM